MLRSIWLLAFACYYYYYRYHVGVVLFVNADSVEVLTDAYKGYKKGKKLKSFVKNVRSMYDVYDVCRAAGGSDEACRWKVTVCFLYKQFGSKYTKGIWQSGYAESLYRNFCLGQPVLKCCYTEDGGGCHSAFNDDAPINCEGNPYYGPTSTAGLCRAPCSTCPGCLCDYIPQCNTLRRRKRFLEVVAVSSSNNNNNNNNNKNNGFSPIQQQPKRKKNQEQQQQLQRQLFAVDVFGEYNDIDFHLGRMDNFLVQLGFFLPRHLNPGNNSLIVPSNDPTNLPLNTLTLVEEVMDFVRFRGCRSFGNNIDILSDGIPDLIPVNFGGDQILTRPDDIMDQLPAIRQMLPYYIVARFVVDIPQFWLKIDYINAIPVNTTQIQQALVAAKISNPTTVLLDWIDYGGLFILQQILGEKWKLLSIPVNTTNWNNLTETPEPPALQSCAKDNGGKVPPVQIDTFKVTITNGLIAFINMKIRKNQGIVAIRTFWGDRSLLDEEMVPTNITTTGANNGLLYLKNHTYSSCGSKRVAVQITNDGLLRTLAVTTINIPCNITTLPPVEPIPPYPNVIKVYIQLDIIATFREVDPGQQIFLFEGAFDIDSTTSFTDLSSVLDSTSFIDLGGYISKSGSNLPLQVNLTFEWDSSPLKALRFTCRTIYNYLYSAGAAKVTNIQIQLMNGEVIDVPYELAFPSSSTDPILCARRGDVFEDDQEVGVLSILPASQGTFVLPPSSSTVDNYFDKDGFYYENYPNRFQYLSTLRSRPTSNKKCGLLSLGFFCPLKCGFWKRLLGIGGCKN